MIVVKTGDDMMKKVIAQIGTFDVENFGDLLFPIILKGKLADFDVDLFSPQGGKKPFEDNTIVYPIKDLEKMCQLKKYAAIIIGGGDLIRLDDQIAKDYKENISISLLLWQYPISVAKRNGIPILWNALGVPFEFKNSYKELVKFIIQSTDYVSVRDRESQKILEECQIENIKIVPDTVLCMDEIIKKQELCKVEKNLRENRILNFKENEYIVFQHSKANISDPLYVKKVKELIDEISKEYKVLFMPIGYVHDDINFMIHIYDPESRNQQLIEKKLSPLEMIAVLSKCKAYIGTSMHGAITSYTYKKPIMVLNPCHLTKINGLLQELKREDANIENIEDAFSYFDTDLFHQTYEEKEKISKKINQHFYNIQNIIKKGKKEPDFEYENEYASICIKNNEMDNKKKKCNTIAIYYDDGDGFYEAKKEKYKNKEENKILIEVLIEDDWQSIRIDPIEGTCLKCKNINITSNGEEIPYSLPNTVTIGEEIYFLTEDPQIILFDLLNFDKIKIDIEYEILELDEILDLTRTLYQKNEELKATNQMNKTKLEKIENSLSYKVAKQIIRN